MPAYTYVCLDCGRRFTVRMSYAEYGTQPVHCLHCGSDRVQRRIGRVRLLGRAEQRLEALADDESMLRALDEDPRTLGRMMREMSRALDEDLGPEFEEVVDRLEKGQTPEEIERELPELSAGPDEGEGDAAPAGNETATT